MIESILDTNIEGYLSWIQKPEIPVVKKITSDKELIENRYRQYAYPYLMLDYYQYRKYWANRYIEKVIEKWKTGTPIPKNRGEEILYYFGDKLPKSFKKYLEEVIND